MAMPIDDGATAAPEDPRTFVLVHGAWHAAAHWNPVVSRLVDLGHRAVAVDLPGSGLRASYPQSYLRNDFTALAVEASRSGTSASPTTSRR